MWSPYPYYATMVHRFLLPNSLSNTGAQATKRRSRRAGAWVLGSVLTATVIPGTAQIPQNNGSSQQENRTSSMGSTPDSSASAVHESLKPQSKDAAGNARGATAGKEHKTEGAGGFNNGLYGTGAGSNK
ncbi:beta-xylosidase [Caballeronia sp. SBC2]|uniref:beta-xylosidase n=1 Tax=Caballeronia sp. SBC2 TaxID=2705547 RepID=UPI001F152116|nr:beta-xylosidase [Caballeronia sp. SBC2]